MRLPIVVLGLVVGCGRSPAPSPVSDTSGASLGQGDAIMLYRSPCYASCPVYSVRVTPDGRVTYEGRQLVSTLGSRTAQISRQRVAALLRELDAAGYFRLADRYRPTEPVCGRYVPDAPTVITAARLGDRVKRIEHDHGCGNAPQALTVLESRIDEALGTVRWTQR